MGVKRRRAWISLGGSLCLALTLGSCRTLPLTSADKKSDRPVVDSGVVQFFVPGDPEVVLIDQATVKWAKGSEFGVDFEKLPPNVATRITRIIATLIERTTWPIRIDSTPC